MFRSLLRTIVEQRWLALLLDTLLFFALNLLDVHGRRRQVLRHCTSQLFDSLPHLLADREMRAVGRVLAMDVLPSNLLFRLSRAEEVGGKLCATHVVENLLTFPEAFSAMDVFGPFSTIQAHVAMILEDREIEGGDDARRACRLGQLHIVMRDLPA